MSRRKRYGRKNKYSQIKWYLVLCAAFLCVGYVVSSIIHAVLSNEETPAASVYVPPYPLHDYDWDCLEWNESLLSYEDDKYTSLQGIDVSAHQEEIDWQAVKESGIDFAFIRVGYRGYEYGYVNDDDYFEDNMEGAIENGIDIGIYFFSQALTPEEALEEAEYVVERLEDYDIQLPVVFDMEETHDYGTAGRTGGMTIPERTLAAVTFLDYIRDAGYTPMIYNSSLLFEQFYDLDDLQDYEFWVADYASYPKYDYEFSIWQYTSSGHIGGVEGRCDMNIMFVEKPVETE